MNVSGFGFVGQKTFLTKGNKICPACIPSGCKIGFSQPELCQARIHMPVKPTAHFPLPALPRDGVCFLVTHSTYQASAFSSSYCHPQGGLTGMYCPETHYCQGGKRGVLSGQHPVLFAVTFFFS